MNDYSKNKVSPKVFYATKTDDDSKYNKNNKKTTKQRESSSPFPPYKPKPKNQNKSDSVWKSNFKNAEQLPTYDKSNEQKTVYADFRQKRSQELLIYSENSCKAVFFKRAKDIVKLFIVKEKTFVFKTLIAYLVENKLGYDVISSDELTAITKTPHHGGIAMIVKKRALIDSDTYIFEAKNKPNDTMIAISGINNPYNLGAIMRTAAFFNVNGVITDDKNLVDSSAAIRVAEGASESITPIITENLESTLTHFKYHQYQIVLLLPEKQKDAKAKSLQKMAFKNKVLFVILQDEHESMINIADECVYLEGNENMQSLNISVATGIVLSHLQTQNKQ